MTPIPGARGRARGVAGAGEDAELISFSFLCSFLFLTTRPALPFPVPSHLTHISYPPQPLHCSHPTTRYLARQAVRVSSSEDGESCEGGGMGRNSSVSTQVVPTGIVSRGRSNTRTAFRGEPQYSCSIAPASPLPRPAPPPPQASNKEQRE